MKREQQVEILLWALVWLLCAAAVISMVSCTKPSQRQEPSAQPSLEERAQGYQAELARHREGGWLVVRTADGGMRNQGDSLTFSGEAMAISCDQAAATLAALERMQTANDGYYVRFDPLPDEYVERSNAVSRDGWIGVAYGMARAAGRCPELRERMAASLSRARDAVSTGRYLHPQAHQAVVTPSFRFVVGTLAKYLAGEQTEDAVRLATFELSAWLSVHAAVGSRTACYPLRLVLMQVLILQAAGSPISEGAKADLCRETAASELRTWDWYCHRDPARVVSWLEEYKPNQITYAHQRCPWETERFPAGDSAASLDWLTLYDLVTRGG